MVYLHRNLHIHSFDNVDYYGEIIKITKAQFALPFFTK
jgi:hypothetical protein